MPMVPISCFAKKTSSSGTGLRQPHNQFSLHCQQHFFFALVVSMHEQIRPWLEAIQAAGTMISALAWLVIAILFAKLLPQVRALASNVEEISVDGPLGTSFSLIVKQSAQMLEQAATEKLGRSMARANSIADPLAGNLREMLAVDDIGLSGTNILWVDDIPSNNRMEERVLRMLGAEVYRSLDTQEAMIKLKNRAFDIVISDMGRPSNPRAGYELLAAMRAAGDDTPFFIYSTSNDPQHAQEARQSGAQGSTNDPRILTAMIVSQLSLG